MATNLLKRLQKARADYAAAGDEFGEARAAFLTAIRSANASGVSQSVIRETAGLSLQQLHQALAVGSDDLAGIVALHESEF